MKPFPANHSRTHHLGRTSAFGSCTDHLTIEFLRLVTPYGLVCRRTSHLDDALSMAEQCAPAMMAGRLLPRRHQQVICGKIG
jgi:hypothetical protein